MKELDALHKYIDDWTTEAHVNVQKAPSAEEACYELGAGALTVIDTMLELLFPDYDLDAKIEVVSSALRRLDEKRNPKPQPEVLA